MTKKLVSLGFSINETHNRNRISLHWAVEKGNVEITKYLIEKGADLEAEDENEATPFLLAAAFGSMAVMDVLISYNCNTAVKNKFGNGPLALAVFYTEFEMAKKLVSLGFNIHETHRYKCTSLHFAVQRGHVEITEYLIGKEADLEAKDENEATPFLRAARFGSTAVMNVLISYKCNTAAKIKCGLDALSLACLYGHSETADFLISNTLFSKKNHGSLLHLVSQQDFDEAVDLLISKGADIEALDDWGCTPFLTAVEFGSDHVINLLIDKGCNTFATVAKTGESAVDMTIKGGRLDLFERFVSAGLTTNQITRETWEFIKNVEVGSNADVNKFMLKVRKMLENGVIKCESDEELQATGNQLTRELQEKLQRRTEIRLLNRTLAEVKLERDTARQDTVCLQEVLEKLETEIQETKTRHAEALEQSRTALQRNSTELGELQRRLKDSEEHCAQQTAELQKCKQTNSDLRRFANIQERRINEKDAKIQKLKEFDNFLRISVEDLEVSDVSLGRGAYGEVKVGKWRGAPVAIKTFHGTIKSDYYNRLFQREMEICSRVRHPNILAIVGVITEGDTPLRIVTNLLEGSLSDVIKAAPPSKPLTLREKVDLSIGFVSGICYLHQLRPTSVLHGDIRSTNILVTAVMEAQVGDLGAARFSDTSLSAGSHSPEYIAPERLRDGNNSEKADIYSLGVTLAELMICEKPDREERYNQLSMIQYGSIQDICLQMVDDSPAERPEASRCLEIFEGLCRTIDYRECSPRRMVKGKSHGQSTVTLANCPW